ncbi:MAG: response regulator, partial [bacterium]|nr:response regulator [bacterium]
QVEHPWVLCDKLTISQVLMNLISNAVKYTNENGHILVSFLETESTKEGLVRFVIKVRDDGIGMSEEFQEKIFDSFERERTSTVSKIYGTGLGMSITKNLTDLMGGEIFLQSKLGEGSEFTIVLELAATDEIREAEEPAIATTAEAEGTEDKKRRVLVVDDNELNRIIATELLQDMGYETEEACNGQEAVDRIRDAEEGVFDLILMDVQMPVMNGYEATKAIRELSSPLSAVPIIALSANAFEEDKKNAMEAGMDAHMAKPIDVDLLSKTLRDLFHNNHSR